MRIIIITILLKITLNRKTLYIPGVTLNTHLDSSLTELPFEAPTLIIISNLTQINGSSEYMTKITKFLNKYINSIGYLPPVEQSALIYSINDEKSNETIFNITKYSEYMNTIIDNGEFKETRYQKVQRSILDY